MTTNGEWLFSKPFDEQVAWMNAEHHDGTLDGDTAALNAKLCAVAAERELYREALSQLLDTMTDGMGKVSALLDSYDEGMA